QRQPPTAMVIPRPYRPDHPPTTSTELTKRSVVILARTPGHAYFRDGGRRADGLHIAFSDLEFAEFSIG
ncbi:hypothetical protein ACGFRF_41020, partial [Streptomyces sp. NPDC048521]